MAIKAGAGALKFKPPKPQVRGASPTSAGVSLVRANSARARDRNARRLQSQRIGAQFGLQANTLRYGGGRGTRGAAGPRGGMNLVGPRYGGGGGYGGGYGGGTGGLGGLSGYGAGSGAGGYSAGLVGGPGTGGMGGLPGYGAGAGAGGRSVGLGAARYGGGTMLPTPFQGGYGGSLRPVDINSARGQRRARRRWQNSGRVDANGMTREEWEAVPDGTFFKDVDGRFKEKGKK